jgi:hypothetical protein
MLMILFTERNGHPEKHPFPIDAMEFGWLIWESFEHPEKQKIQLILWNLED